MTKEQIIRNLAALKPVSFMSESKGSQAELTISGWTMQGDAEDIDEAATFLAQVTYLIVMARKSLSPEEE